MHNYLGSKHSRLRDYISFFPLKTNFIFQSKPLTLCIFYKVLCMALKLLLEKLIGHDPGAHIGAN